MTDWLDELDDIRKDDETKQQEQKAKIDLSSSNRYEQATSVLKICNVHTLLRRVNGALLHDKGVIDIFDRTDEYDRAITLVWQGSVSKARTPDTTDPSEFQYIVVGAKGSKLYVNGRNLKSNTPETLKKTLVWAAKNPKKQAPK